MDEIITFSLINQFLMNQYLFVSLINLNLLDFY